MKKQTTEHLTICEGCTYPRILQLRSAWLPESVTEMTKNQELRNFSRLEKRSKTEKKIPKFKFEIFQVKNAMSYRD